MSRAAPRLVVGVEVHVQLAVRTKAFCACPVLFGAEPNSLVCPVCLGHPGALPVLNRAALEAALRAGLALGCAAAPQGRTQWDRKNYFYPDLPKGYQITQYALPLCEGGEVRLASGTRVRIRRAHLEEDTGKSSHAEDGATLVDFNRCGVPLLEIVTDPLDPATPEEVEEYLRILQERLRAAGASEAAMEKGQMRCEPNVSLARADGSSTAISELKNLNSFAAVREAVAHEAKRLADGPWHPRDTALPRATYGWDDAGKRTVLQRSKETAADYRYFPEPDLPVLPASALEGMIERAKAALAQAKAGANSEDARIRGLAERYELELARAMKLLADTVDRDSLGHVFTETAQVAEQRGLDPKEFGPTLANWLQGPIPATLRARSIKASMVKASGRSLAVLLERAIRKEVPSEVVKTRFLGTDWLETGADPDEVLKSEGLLGGAAGEDAVRAACDEAVALNPDVVAKIRAGKAAAKQALVGQVMKKTRGTADPARVSAILDDLLA